MGIGKIRRLYNIPT